MRCRERARRAGRGRSAVDAARGRARHRGRAGAARARAHPPLVRLRARRPADQRAAGVPRRRRARPGGHRRPLPRAPRPARGRSWPSCGPASSTPARSRASPASLGPRPVAAAGPRRGGHRRPRQELDPRRHHRGACSARSTSTAVSRRPSALVQRLFDPLMHAAAHVRRGAGLEDRAAGAHRRRAVLGVPDYRLDESGPDHAKSFTAVVLVGRRAARRGRRPQQEGGRAAGRRDRLRGAVRPTVRRRRARRAVPELPEVEVVRRGLERGVAGRTVADVAVTHPRAVRRHVAGAADFAARLPGRTVTRRAAAGQVPLAAARLGRRAHRPPRHERPAARGARRTRRCTEAPARARALHRRRPGARAALRRPAHLRRPARRRRTATPSRRCSRTSPATRSTPQFDDDAFVAGLRRRRTGVKRALLDQTLVSGIGNIYADETLWRARLHGERPTDVLTRPAARRLLAHARDVLHRGDRRGRHELRRALRLDRGRERAVRALARRLRPRGPALLAAAARRSGASRS